MCHEEANRIFVLWLKAQTLPFTQNPLKLETEMQLLKKDAKSAKLCSGFPPLPESHEQIIVNSRKT